MCSFQDVHKPILVMRGNYSKAPGCHGSDHAMSSRCGSCADCILAPSARRLTACSGLSHPRLCLSLRDDVVRRHSTTRRTHVRAVIKVRVPLTAPLWSEIQDMPNGRQQIDTALFYVAGERCQSWKSTTSSGASMKPANSPLRNSSRSARSAAFHPMSSAILSAKMTRNENWNWLSKPATRSRASPPTTISLLAIKILRHTSLQKDIKNCI